jgi:A/G-specific adenine glycosylase
VEKRLWQLAAELLPARNVGSYIQAQMDLGATVCTRGKPRCGECPLAAQCVARRDGRVAELPQAKLRRALPERTATVLLLMHEKRILLEQRPPTGIWGGLLALPELPAGSDVHAHAASLGCRIESVAEMSPLLHTFTHFRLTLQPLRVTVAPLPHAAESGRRWIAAAETKSAPLPAPIRILLDRVFSASL